MRGPITASILAVLIACGPLWAAGGDMGVGTDPNTNGSETYPWLIEDLADFDAFATDPNYWAAGVHTQLMTDIDLSGRTYTTAVIAPDINDATGGYQGTPFAGVFDGNDFAIIDLTIDTVGADKDCLGLFGQVFGSAAEIKNLGIKNIIILGGSQSFYIGSLAGHANMYGSITNCYSTGSLSGFTRVCGLVTYNYNGSIINCYSSCSVNATGDDIGGLVSVNDGIITNSYSNGEVCGGPSSGLTTGGVGGLVGRNNNGLITNCYSTGEVSGIGIVFVGGFVGRNDSEVSSCFSTSFVDGDKWAGGMVGVNYNIISNSYSSGEVTGDMNVGGLCGYNPGEIINSYSTGFVNGSGSYVGGLVGGSVRPVGYGSVLNCFWDVETSGINDGVGDQDPDPAGVEGKTTAEMMMQTNFAGWDFSDEDGADWMMLREGEDTPRLAWQAVFAGDVAGLYGVDMADFAYLANYWGLDDCNGVDDCGRADIDGSGDVGLGDLVEVGGDWLLK